MMSPINQHEQPIIMNNTITKKLDRFEFYLTSYSWRLLLPDKPGIVVIECKRTGKLSIRSGANVKNLVSSLMTTKVHNIFYKKRNLIKRDDYLFWTYVSNSRADYREMAKNLGYQFSHKVYDGKDEPIDGYRGYMLLHKPSGYYHLLLKESRPFDFSAWYRKFVYKLNHEEEYIRTVDVISLTSHSGRRGVLKEDFVVYPLFAGQDDPGVVHSLMSEQVLINGSDKLMTRGVVPEDEWELGKRLSLLRK